MGAAADCELIRAGLLAQPVNATTCVALAAAGAFLARRPTSRWVGMGLIATGFGSFLFHGPLAPGGEWIHDVTLAWLVLLVAMDGHRRERWARLPGLAVIGVAFALAPSVADGITAAIAAIGIARLLLADRSPKTSLPLALLALVAVVGRLGSTGGPLCDPASLFQPHGLWHVGAAIAVGWWAVAREQRLPMGDVEQPAETARR